MNILEKLFDTDKFKGNQPDDLEHLTDRAASHIYQALYQSEDSIASELALQSKQFEISNLIKWNQGFRKMDILRAICVESAVKFQNEFLKIPKYHTDPLIGTLLRLHANACRVTAEIILLLKGGFPDGAIARWRTLFEILVTCRVLKKFGIPAAEDYIRHGKVKSLEGLIEYQNCAEAMKHSPLNEEEILLYIKDKENISKGNPSFHWARDYLRSTKIDKQMESVGLKHWFHYYKLASRNIHSDYTEMLTLYGMRDSTQDGLLVGPSNSGMAEPASMTAITLGQITSTFLTAHMEENEIDYTDSIIFMLIIEKYVNDIQNTFKKCD